MTEEQFKKAEALYARNRELEAYVNRLEDAKTNIDLYKLHTDPDTQPLVSVAVHGAYEGRNIIKLEYATPLTMIEDELFKANEEIALNTEAIKNI